MRRLTYFVALTLTLCCGWSFGFKSTPSYAPYLAPTNTVSASLTPVYVAQTAPVEAMEAVPMETIDIVFIGILFVVGVLVWALVRSNFITANLIPSDLVKEIVRTAVSTVLDAVDARAKDTETKADDEMAALVRREVTAALLQAGITLTAPTDNGAVG